MAEKAVLSNENTDVEKPAERQIWVGGVHRVGIKYWIYQWRAAIEYYLEKIWSGDAEFMQSPQIYFASLYNRPRDTFWNHAVLDLDSTTHTYSGYWLGKIAPSNVTPDFDRDKIITVGSNQPAVEWGLARFLKDRKIKMLIIRFPVERWMCLVKEDGGSLEIHGNFPHQKLL